MKDDVQRVGMRNELATVVCSMIINVEFVAGTGISEACHEAIEIAKRLGCSIHFSFNGVKCYAHPMGSAVTLINNYTQELNGGNLKMAFSK